jgi:hypothetical protein
MKGLKILKAGSGSVADHLYSCLKTRNKVEGKIKMFMIWRQKFYLLKLRELNKITYKFGGRKFYSRILVAINNITYPIA